MDLKVLYEDNHLIVVDKKEKIPSQLDNTKDKDILTIVKEYIKVKYQKKNNVYLGLLHRLDRVTSGVMVFAKTEKAAKRMSNLIRENQIQKEYLFVTLDPTFKIKKDEKENPISSKKDLEFKENEITNYNLLDPKEQNFIKSVETSPSKIFTLQDYLLKDKKKNKVSIVKKGTKDSKYSKLEFREIGTTSVNNKELTLINVNLITGRSHQIRTQFSSRNIRIFGDLKYGFKKEDYFLEGKKNKEKFTIDAIGLHAYKLSFIHPVKKEKVTIYSVPTRYPFNYFTFPKP